MNTYKIATTAQAIYDMTGWTDANGEHPGDGVPRLFHGDDGWTLWTVIGALGEHQTLRSTPLNTHDRELAAFRAGCWLTLNGGAR